MSVDKDENLSSELYSTSIETDGLSEELDVVNAKEEEDSEKVVEKKNGSKKGNVKKVVAVAGLIAVVGIVGAGTLMLLNSPAPTAPVTASAPSAPLVEEPSDDLAADQPTEESPLDATVSPDLVAEDPLAAIAGQDLISAPDLVAAPDVVNAQEATDLAVSPANPAVALDVAPTDALDLTEPQAAPVATVAPSAPVDPPVAPLASGPNDLGDDISKKVGEAVLGAIRPELDSMNGRITNLEKKVENQRNAPRAAAPRAATPRSQPARSSAPAPVRRAPAPAKNEIVVLGSDLARVSRPAPAPVVAAPVAEVKKSSGCKLTAVMRGRAWLKLESGESITVGVGDKLPDGKTISEISEDRGILVDGKVWSCD